ncbi:hypothetical protein Cadr_000002655, partial [Camelus dromedarius]
SMKEFSLCLKECKDLLSQKQFVEYHQGSYKDTLSIPSLKGSLIQQLEKFLEKVESDRLGNGVNHKKNR